MSIAMTKHEVLEPEGVYVAFPFALAEPTFWLETAGAVFRPEVEQLPGTCRDWYSVQHAVGISDGRVSVLWTTHEAPLVQLGGIHTGQWAKRLDAPVGHVYAWLMNNLYFTNFKAAQGGSMSFSFGISARAGAIDADAVRGAGERAALPLQALVVDGRAPGRRALLSLESPDVTAVAVALDPDGRAVRLRLQASSRGADAVTLAWHGTRPLAAWHSDMFGNRTQPVAGDGRTFALRLAADELGTIVIEPITAEAGSAHG